MNTSVESTLQNSNDTHLKDCAEGTKPIANCDDLEVPLYVICYFMYSLTF
jgi:hypothetical protein